MLASALLGDKLNVASGDFLLVAINSCLRLSSDCRRGHLNDVAT
jgi:hypothetical protein